MLFFSPCYSPSLRQIILRTKRIAAIVPCSDDGNLLLRVLRGSEGRLWNVVLGFPRRFVRFPCHYESTTASNRQKEANCFLGVRASAARLWSYVRAG